MAKRRETSDAEGAHFGHRVQQNTRTPQRSKNGVSPRALTRQTGVTERATDLRPDEDDGRLGAVVADLLDPGVADVSVGDVVVDGEAEEEDVLKWKKGERTA